MESNRIQLVTNAVCPNHSGHQGHDRIYVVVTVSSEGAVDIWHGCERCPGAGTYLRGGNKNAAESNVLDQSEQNTPK